MWVCEHRLSDLLLTFPAPHALSEVWSTVEGSYSEQTQFSPPHPQLMRAENEKVLTWEEEGLLLNHQLQLIMCSCVSWKATVRGAQMNSRFIFKHNRVEVKMQKTSKSRHLYATLKSQVHVRPMQMLIFVLLVLVQLVYQPHLGYQRTAHLLSWCVLSASTWLQHLNGVVATHGPVGMMMIGQLQESWYSSLNADTSSAL